MTKGKAALLLAFLSLTVLFSMSVSDVGGSNDNIVEMYSERATITLPAWEIVLVDWINAVLPGIVLMAIVIGVPYARWLMSNNDKDPQIIGGDDGGDE